ncbi:TDP-N-acetylfucosamine:lipid II N-acetylfucosaminyltransferase [Vibrio cholerae]|uniref:TDP-N-acetylfucosamine:lipid II N-acetylfucosaminyltransferase n=1 Tax=Vibrio cholerae TaxID=666 RepID=UPI001C53FF97|nr:TDP-N-acetylfucosamine:lipid II N-acetylfucosaminyltransferase [Vibrio cholerae]
MLFNKKYRNKIMHIAYNSERNVNKFVPAYSKMLSENLKNDEHSFYYVGEDEGLHNCKNKHVLKHTLSSAFLLGFLMLKHKKTIFHCAPPAKLSIILSFFLVFYSDASIVIWGGELGREDKNDKKSLSRWLYLLSSRLLIKGCSNAITYIDEDYKYAKENINKSLDLINLGGFYPSNLIDKKYKNNPRKSESVSILVGTSALRRNKHMMLIDLLSKIENELDYKVYIPLSYGDDSYAEEVIKYAYENLPEGKIHVIQHMLPYDEYIRFLNTIDVALFGHIGQQGMGNITQLIAMGKMVFLNPSSDSWKYFNSLGLDVYSLESFKLENVKFCSRNCERSYEIFSKEKSLLLQKEFFSN